MDHDQPTSIARPGMRWRSLGIVALLAMIFAAHAGLIARSKSSTYDEPIHTLSSWLIVNRGDFRVNPEHPALWKYVAGLGLVGTHLPVDLGATEAQQVLPVVEQQWPWARSVLYLQNPNPAGGEALVARARLPMLLFGIALVCVVARWAWAWGGPTAAIIAAALLALDPNFLAHAGLVTNDVAATLFITLAVYLTWRLGTNYARSTAAALILTVAAAVSIKFTCLLLAPMLGLPLLLRIMDASPWPVGRLPDVRSKERRFALVIGVGLACGLVAWALLWPVYQFRTAPTRSGARFDDSHPRTLLAYYNLMRLDERNPPAARKSKAELLAAAAAAPHGGLSECLFTLSEQRLVPQAWGFGLNYANARSVLRDSYLLGQVSDQGSRAYFPLVMLFKTPAATLILVLGCAIVGAAALPRQWRHSAARWKLACLLLPPIVYFAAATFSNLNIGIRHILPVYPPMFVAVGVILARFIRRWKFARLATLLAIAALGVETLSATPDLLNFFNAFSRTPRGGFEKLGDSNLDWGQDLKSLGQWYAGWRALHPDEPFYLSYFGSVPPGAYGIDYRNAPPGTDFDRQPRDNDMQRGVYAISASHLQGISKPYWADAMARLRAIQPDEVLHGTIYIYRIRPDGPIARSPLRPASPQP